MGSLDREAESLRVALDRLAALSSDELKQRWTELGRPPLPKFMRKGMILRAVAHALQENTLGGLDRDTQKRLDRLVAQIVPAGERPPRKPLSVKPGTRFLREWRGRSYVVTAERNGFLWEGRRYKSLSAVARAISGTRWNGHTFFGLKRNGHDASASRPGGKPRGAKPGGRRAQAPASVPPTDQSAKDSRG